MAWWQHLFVLKIQCLNVKVACWEHLKTAVLVNGILWTFVSDYRQQEFGGRRKHFTSDITRETVSTSFIIWAEFTIFHYLNYTNKLNIKIKLGESSWEPLLWRFCTICIFFSENLCPGNGMLNLLAHKKIDPKKVVVDVHILYFLLYRKVSPFDFCPFPV